MAPGVPSRVQLSARINYDAMNDALLLKDPASLCVAVDEHSSADRPAETLIHPACPALAPAAWDESLGAEHAIDHVLARACGR